MEARFKSSVEDQTSLEEKEHQKLKYEALLDTLISAGYYRARITGLDEFDKVVGGLCWCITSSGEDVDVDILFQENSTIGQRIKLCETIVNVLRTMKCPHPLQAHQIQGLDFNSLYPVIVWLIGKFFENRELTAALLRKYSMWCFDVGYKDDPTSSLQGQGFENLEADLDDEEKEFSEMNNLDNQNNKGRTTANQLYEALRASDHAPTLGLASLKAAFPARRKFRRPMADDGSMTYESENAHVYACLLEYGDSAAIGLKGDSSEGSSNNLEKEDASGLSAFERKFRAAQKEAEKEEELLRKQAAEQMSSLLNELEDESSKKGDVKNTDLRNVIGLQSDAINSAKSEYLNEMEQARRKLEEEREGLSGQEFALLSAYRRKKEALDNEIEKQNQINETIAR